MIMRKIVSIVSSYAAKCIDSFPRHLLFRILLDNGVVARKVGHPLSANSNSIFVRDVIPSSLRTIFSAEVPLLFRTWTNNDHCPTPNFFASMETTLSCASHSSSLSFLSQEMSLNIDINKILPVKVSGVCPKSLSRSLILPRSCNVVNPGKMFHSNSVGSPLIPS